MLSERIMDKFLYLGLNQGFSRVTMDQLASELEISKKTIYKIFKSKEEIVQACVDKIFNDIDNKIIPVMKNTDLDVLSKMNRVTSSVAESLKFLPKIQTMDFQRTFPEVWKNVNKERELRIKRYEYLFASGIQDGVFRHYNPKILVHIYIFLLQELTSTSFLQKYDMTWAEAIEMVKAIIMHGIILPSERPNLKGEEENWHE